MAREQDSRQAVPHTPGMRPDPDGVTRRRPLPRQHVEETVEVAVPVRTAYNQWTQFKTFPGSRPWCTASNRSGPP